ncbi:hypothetical protein [uncultured Enterococcus sp.]|uniref:hypothetical protein n=1 Tax=uncultured Enterococcus sp. TaxID=167972 RepID=UPI002AA8AD87|nr:hypothetical protein [uncultured Enterococcus sp.]
MTLISDTRYDSWPDGAPEDGDYVNFGEVGAHLSINREDWSSFTQIKLSIEAECKNVINPAIVLTLENDGEIKIPDIYNREGTHVINLEGQEKQTYVLDISNLPRDAVTGIYIFSGANGSYMNLDGQLSYSISELYLEKNKHNTSAKGWQAPKKGRSSILISAIIRIFRKTAIIHSDDFLERTFKVRSTKENQTVLKKEIAIEETANGTFWYIGFF